jgi:hypothetical protein
LQPGYKFAFRCLDKPRRKKSASKSIGDDAPRLMPSLFSRTGRRHEDSLKPTDEVHERNTDCQAKRPQLQYVESPLAAFTLADEGLRFPETRRQFHLRDAPSFPSGSQLTKRDLVLLRRNGLVHGAGSL